MTRSTFLAEWKHAFESDYAVFWGSLSRLNSLQVVMNISMFFLTGLVANGYYYTCYSLICLCVLGVGTIVPTPWIRRPRYYSALLMFELAGLYFLVASIVYGVNSGAS